MALGLGLEGLALVIWEAYARFTAIALWPTHYAVEFLLIKPLRYGGKLFLTPAAILRLFADLALAFIRKRIPPPAYELVLVLLEAALLAVAVRLALMSARRWPRVATRVGRGLAWAVVLLLLGLFPGPLVTAFFFHGARAFPMFTFAILVLAAIVLLMGALPGPSVAASRLRQARTGIARAGKALAVMMVMTFVALAAASIPLPLVSFARYAFALPQRVVTTARLQDGALPRADDPESHSDDLEQLLAIGRSNESDAVDAQARFIEARRSERWALMPWRLLQGPGLRALPEGTRQAEAVALATIEVFFAHVPDEDASAELLFTADLREAHYSLTVSHWHGPLAGSWQTFMVRLRRTSSGWVVTDAREGGWMIS